MAPEKKSFTDDRGLAQRWMESPFVVSIYESRLWRRSPLVERAMGIAFTAELETVARAGRIGNAKRVLDLACGSGIYTRPFARRMKSGRVTGLDISPPMLAYARKKSRAEGIQNLDLVRGSALTLPFKSHSFDVVNCCGALHLFPDVPRVLAEIYSVLAPGGRFTAAVIRAEDSARGRRKARLRRRMLGVHSFTRGDLGKMLDQAGFARFEILHEGSVWMVATASK